jgi:hypothetical protein
LDDEGRRCDKAHTLHFFRPCDDLPRKSMQWCIGSGKTLQLGVCLFPSPRQGQGRCQLSSR